MLILVGLLLVSCINDDNEKIEAEQTIANDIVKPEMYGFYHNEAITLYNKSYNEQKQDITKVSIESLIKNMITALQKEYPNEFKEVTSEKILAVYKDYKVVGDYNFVENWNKNKINYLKNGNISQSLFDFIDDIVTHNDDFEIILSKSKILKNSEKISSKDLMQLEMFESVLYSSKKLWSDRIINAKIKVNYCNQQIIVSDAATTLIFGAGGPFALIAGAVSSLITSSTGDCVNP